MTFGGSTPVIRALRSVIFHSAKFGIKRLREGEELFRFGIKAHVGSCAENTTGFAPAPSLRNEKAREKSQAFVVFARISR